MEEKCFMECTSCEEEFDIEKMESDAGDNLFCPECWKELGPVMEAEYQELISNGEIEE